MFDKSVRERDLDHFLLEELHSSPEFRRWFIERVGFVPPSHAAFRVERSPQRVSDGRQTDLRLGFYDAQGELVACILIENKVTDSFQDGQAESYACEIGQLCDQWGEGYAMAVLVAPASNVLGWNPHFAACVTLEEMTRQLAGRLTEVDNAELRSRLEVKIELLEALSGKRGSSRWTPEAIPAKRDFAQAYAALLAEECKGLRLRPSSHGKKASTLFFDGVPHKDSLPCRVELKHELGKGEAWKHANLQFSGAVHLLENFAREPGLFPPDGSIFPADGGGSLMIRIKTPGIAANGEQFDAQRQHILEGMSALRRLCEWMEMHHATLRRMLA